jgi:hypothetical protein
VLAGYTAQRGENIMPKVRLRRYEAEDGRLPRVCMCCGAPSDVEKIKTFSWTPPWVGFLILLSILPYIIVALVLTQRCRARVPLCNQHSNHWSWRVLATLLSFFAIIVVGVGAVVLMSAAAGKQGGDTLGMLSCFGSIGLFVAWLIVLYVIQQTAIRPTEITERSITLTHVSEDFIRAMEEMDRDRDDDWDDRDRYAPRLPPDATERFRPDSRRGRYGDHDRDEGERGRRRRDDDRGHYRE